MYHVGICDDEPIFRAHLSEMTVKVLTELNIPHNLTLFQNIEELDSFLADPKNTLDLLLLDILMEGTNGMDFAVRQSETGRTPIPFLFVTSTLDFALEGYKVNSLDYLLKPVQEKTLKSALLRAWKKHEKQYILLSTPTQTFRLNPEEILYAEINDKILTIHTRNGETIQTFLSLNALTQKLPPHQFIQCHRSYLVSLSAIHSIWRYSVELINHEQIPVSKKNYMAVQEALIHWVENS